LKYFLIMIHHLVPKIDLRGYDWRSFAKFCF